VTKDRSSLSEISRFIETILYWRTVPQQPNSGPPQMLTGAPYGNL